MNILFENKYTNFCYVILTHCNSYILEAYYLLTFAHPAIQTERKLMFYFNFHLIFIQAKYNLISKNWEKCYTKAIAEYEF